MATSESRAAGRRAEKAKSAGSRDASGTPRAPEIRGPGRPVRNATTGRDAALPVRAALLTAAGPLFAARGFDGVSIREVARSAHVTPAMIHYYFGDKQGLHTACFDATLDHLLGRIRAASRAEATGGDVIGAFVRTVVRTLREDPWIPQLLMREVLIETGRHRARFVERYLRRVAELLPALLSRQIAEGRLRGDLDPQLATISLVGMSVFPVLARPAIEPAFGLEYDEAFLERLVVHTERLFGEGADASERSRGGGDGEA